jgi:hypothetical protein
MMTKRKKRARMIKVTMESKAWNSRLKSSQRIKATRMIKMMARTRRWKSLKESRMMPHT